MERLRFLKLNSIRTVDPMEGLIPEEMEDEILDKDDHFIYKDCSFRSSITI